METMEEDQMIAPSAQAKQEQKSDQNRFFGGMTPQNLLSSGQTPHNLLASPAIHNQPQEQSSSHVYGPVPSPAPQSPMPRKFSVFFRSDSGDFV